MQEQISQLHQEEQDNNAEKKRFIRSYIRRIVSALRDNRAIEDRIEPKFSKKYLSIVEALIDDATEHVTKFHGGPLDFEEDGITDVWLTPIEIRDQDGFTNFHVIAIGCNNGQDFENATVHIDLTPEDQLKLATEDNELVSELHKKLHQGGDSPRIIIRPNFTSSIAYPLISTPNDIPEKDIFKDRLQKLLSYCNIESDLEKIDYEPLEAQKFELSAEFENFWLSEPRHIESEMGTVWVYDVMALNDPWRYYQILAFDDLKNIRQNPNLITRTDSGCDIGMLYHDEGCDCHPQLLSALQEAKDFKGLVVHIPTHDDRGYGISGIETEAHKRGIPSVFNLDESGEALPAMGSRESAMRLFGENYDIRTYDGVTRMLEELGFRNITVITDNTKKIEQMLKGRTRKDDSEVIITSKETGTQDNVTSEKLRKHLENRGRPKTGTSEAKQTA